MQAFRNLILVGTSHIAKQSIEDVERVIRKEKPDVVALELDRGRFYGLMHGVKGRIGVKEIRTIGFKGYLFAKIGEFAERKLGSEVGVSPGDEMLKAAKVAGEVGSKIALIDQKIEVTLKNFSIEVTWRERFRLVWDIIMGIFSKKNRISIDLTKVPKKELIEKMLSDVKKKYPSVYKVLVEDRNKYMAKKLFKLMKNFNKIVAVIGAGHEDELIDEIKKIEKAN